MPNTSPASLQPCPSASMARTAVSGSWPLPPYSVGNGSPWTPIAAQRFHSSRENSLS